MREVAPRGWVLEELSERLQPERQDDATQLGRGDATIAPIEAAGTAEVLDYAGQRQALSDLEVRVAGYPTWNESAYRCDMSALEERDGKRRQWVDDPLRLDSQAHNIAAAGAAASPFRRRGESELAIETVGAVGP